MKFPAILSIILYLFFQINAYSQTTHTLLLQPGPEDGIDCEIRTDMNWPIWYEDDFIANAWTVQGNPFIERSLLKFDLSALPEAAQIISAKLSLYCNTSTGHHQIHSGNNACYLLKIIEPWNQYEVTWDSQPATTLEDSVIIQQSSAQIQDYPDIDVTGLIDYFYHNPEQNYGFMLQLVEEIQYAAMVFSSSNHVDPQKRPLLTIQYSSCAEPFSKFIYRSTNNLNEFQFYADTTGDCSYWWDFGNGFYSDLEAPKYTFPESGIYEICLTMTNDCGTSTSCQTINLSGNPFIEAEFTYKIEGNIVSFTPKNTFTNVIYTWDFGDGYQSSLQNPVHLYYEGQNYNACLTITDNFGSVTSCDSVLFIFYEHVNVPEDIKIFPNPSSGEVSIFKNGVPAEFKSIKVINFNGTEILDENHYRLKKTDKGYYCDFTGMESGIYTIHVVTDIGIFTQKAIVLSK